MFSPEISLQGIVLGHSCTQHSVCLFEWNSVVYLSRKVIFLIYSFCLRTAKLYAKLGKLHTSVEDRKYTASLHPPIFRGDGTLNLLMFIVA